MPALFLALFFWVIDKNLLAKKAWYFFGGVALAGLVNMLIKSFFGRARPTLLDQGIYGFDWFEHSSHYLSFPSGHTNTIVAAMTILFFWFPKYRLFWLMTGVLVAFSRVILGKHYLSDIIAGAFVAILFIIFWRNYWHKRGCMC